MGMRMGWGVGDVWVGVEGWRMEKEVGVGGYMLRTGVGYGEGMYNYVRYEGSVQLYRVGW